MTRIYNRTEEKIKRKMLRNNTPQAEVILWSKLKGKGLEGYKFRRQYSIGKFVIDFYCPKLKLAIEVDGDSHFDERADVPDRERQAIIVTVVPLQPHEVKGVDALKNLGSVLFVG